MSEAFFLAASAWLALLTLTANRHRYQPGTAIRTIYILGFVEMVALTGAIFFLKLYLEA